MLSSVRDIRRCGAAALDLAWTAAGRFDAFFERTVKPWDTAAGALLCECAGLEVHELAGRPGLPDGILAAAAGAGARPARPRRLAPDMPRRARVRRAAG